MLTKKQIRFLNEVCPNIWTETNGVISVEGNVYMDDMNLTQIPVPFGKVTGYFSCYNNQLTSLEGAPFSVGDYFNCQKNYLTSLEGGPKEIGDCYSCSNNQLINLIGAPKVCNDTFYCHTNNLTSLEGCPSIIKVDLYCNNNPLLKYLWGIGRVKDSVLYNNRNEINEWIIACARKDIIFPHFTFEENMNWIKDTIKYKLLLDAPEKIRQHFSSYVIRALYLC